MTIINRVEEFNKRWNIPDDTADPGAEFSKFKTRIINILTKFHTELYENESAQEYFCKAAGILRTRGNDIGSALTKEWNEKDFYLLLEFLFDAPMEWTWGRGVGTESFNRGVLLKEVQSALEFSNVNLKICEVGNSKIICCPKGEELLDKKIVDNVLSFLDVDGLPHKHFVEALKSYQNKNSIKSAESLRRALEEFLRIKLNNKTGLKENMRMLREKFKNVFADPQVKNIVSSIINYLDTYWNENSKHNDGDISEEENEFLIYQVGLVMRYIDGVIK